MPGKIGFFVAVMYVVVVAIIGSFVVYIVFECSAIYKLNILLYPFLFTIIVVEAFKQV